MNPYIIFKDGLLDYSMSLLTIPELFTNRPVSYTYSVSFYRVSSICLLFGFFRLKTCCAVVYRKQICCLKSVLCRMYESFCLGYYFLLLFWSIIQLLLQFFTTKPYACEPSSLPKYPPSKEMDAKLRDEEARRWMILNTLSFWFVFCSFYIFVLSFWESHDYMN